MSLHDCDILSDFPRGDPSTSVTPYLSPVSTRPPRTPGPRGPPTTDVVVESSRKKRTVSGAESPGVSGTGGNVGGMGGWVGLTQGTPLPWVVNKVKYQKFLHFDNQPRVKHLPLLSQYQPTNPLYWDLVNPVKPVETGAISATTHVRNPSKNGTEGDRK